MKKLVFIIVLFFVTTGLAWGQNDFEANTKRFFSCSIIKSVEMNKGVGKIIFKDLTNNPTYFRSGDKINEIFTI